MSIDTDAIDLVVWFESQPDCGTYKSDEQIGAALGWLVGGQFPKNSSARQRARGGSGPDGDAGRVRRTRRYVDRNNDTQPFMGYQFGTKRNGAGRRWMMLHTPNGSNGEDALNESASEQMLRAVQQSNQASAEQARMIGKLTELEESYTQAGKYHLATVVHDAARELQFFGKLTMTTLQAARKHGILEQVRES